MQALRRLVAAIFILVALWLLVVVNGVLPRPSDAQRDALARMRADEPPAGRANAFATLQLGLWDVPEAELEAATDAEVAAFLAHATPGAAYASPVAARYPRFGLPEPADPALCPRRAGTCLDRVRAHPAATRAVLDKHAALLARQAALARYDHFRYRLAPRLDAPLPPLGHQALPLSQAALRFVDGDVDGAFAQTCGFAATWRRLRAHTDSLIVDAVGAALVADAARLYAEMLAERDVPAAAVAACDAAFAPLADAEFEQCASLRTEFRMLEAAMRDVGTERDPRPADERSVSDRLIRPLLNREHTAALVAVALAPLCGDEHRARIAARAPLREPARAGNLCSLHEQAFNPIGCILASVAAPDYGPYYGRLLDLDARLRAVGVARWLRANPDAAFDDRPHALRTPHHAMRYDAAARTLTVAALDGDPDKAWTIRVAPAPAPPDGTPPSS